MISSSAWQKRVWTLWVGMILLGLGGVEAQVASAYTLSASVTTATQGYIIQSPQQADYPAGTTVTLYAGARQGYEFSGWTGNVPMGQEMSNPLTLAMDTTKTLVATFCVIPGGTLQSWKWYDSSQDSVPTSATGFMAIAVGGYEYTYTHHRLGLKSDGSIVAWGYNDSGQCSVPSPNADFIAVSAGTGHSLALKSDGSVVAWGDNVLDQCRVPVPNSGFVAISTGGIHNLGLKSDGSIVAWGGDNSNGQLNVPAPNTGFVAVAAGDTHSIGLKSDGSIVAWGNDGAGQWKVPAPNTGFVAIAAASYHSLGLKSDGSIVGWGIEASIPTPNSGFVAVSTGDGYSVGLKSDGSIVGWSNGSGGAWNLPASNTGFDAIAAGNSCLLAIKSHGNLKVTIDPPQAVTEGAQWRLTDEPAGVWHNSGVSISSTVGEHVLEYKMLAGWLEPTTQTVTLLKGKEVSVAAEYVDTPMCTLSTTATHGFIMNWPIRPDYLPGTTITLYAQAHQGAFFTGWGGNVPAGREMENPLVFSITADTTLTASFRQDSGKVKAWGTNGKGQCSVPEPNRDFVAVAGGGQHSLGLKTDGTIVAWGGNDDNQCSVSLPNQDFVGIAAGNSHSLGLKSDGTIVAWGNNSAGQCNIPEPNADFVSVVGSDDYSMGLKKDGRIIVWGNYHRTPSSVPRFLTIAGGHLCLLGLKQNGSISAWGSFAYDITVVPEPNRDFTSIMGGYDFNLALKKNGEIVGWGNRGSGQLNFGSGTGYVGLAAGWKHSLALHSSGSVVAKGSNDYGQCDVPAPNIGFVSVAAGWGHSLAISTLGRLKTTLAPSKAIAAGAQWRLTSEAKGLWHNSGDTVTTRTGTYTLTFKDAYGWIKPADQSVEIELDRDTSGTGNYRLTSWTLVTASENGAIQVSPTDSSFPHGTTVTLMAQPGGGYWFDHWTGDVPVGQERINPLAIRMDANKVIGADLESGPLPSAPVITSFKINNNAVTAVNPTVVLANTCTAETSGSATQYLASESPNFVGAAWRPYGTVSMFRLSEGAGVKTVYYKVKNSVGAESAVTSDTITLAGDDFSVVAWGRNTEKQCSVPSLNSDFVAIAGGEAHSLALKADGSVVTWGRNVGTLPSPNSGFVAIGGGDLHSAFLKSDGSTLGGPGGTSPLPNQNIVAIAAGHSHDLGLKSDGSIVVWGTKLYGLFNIPFPNRDFVSVAAGDYHCLGLKTDGSVVGWGNNNYGQCTVPSPNSGFVAIAGGGNHSLGLKSDGSIVAWGDNRAGQCSVPTPNSNFIAVAAGMYFSLGLKSDGSIVAWGQNTYSQCNVPVPNTGFVAIAGGGYHALALAATGDLEVALTPPEAIAAGARWRLTDEAKDVWHDTTVYDPVTKTTSKTLRSRVGVHTLTFKDVYGWNKPADQAVELTTTATAQAAGAYTRVDWPLSVACTSGTVLVSPAGSSFPHGTTVTLTAQPDAGMWFDRWTGNVPAGWERVNPLVLTMNSTKTLTAQLASGPPPAAPVITAFKINNGAATAVNPTVTLFSACTAATSGSAAQYLASESADFTSATWRPYGPIPMFTLSGNAGVKTVYFKVKNSAEVESAVTSDTIALAGSDLALVAWGSNFYGQCALPAPGSGFVEVAAGEKHNLGLKADGTVVAWGDNYFNQCRIPAPNRDFVSVSTGWYHNLGLKKDGSVVAWGYNSSKQCMVPSPNSNFVAIAAGGSHSLGLKADGSIVAWGYNYYGQCTVPSPNSGFVAIAAGSHNSLALKADGSIVEWGYDNYDNWTIPLPNSGFVAIAAGVHHRLALKSDGTIVAWGENGKRQCNVASPNSGFVAIKAGYYHSLGLKSDGSIVTWGDNAQGQCTVPSPNHGYVALVAGGDHSLALAPGGDLQMTLTPPEAVAAGARWRLSSEAANVWHNDTVYDPVSNTSSTALRAQTGFHALTFKDLYGWTKPQDRDVEITTGGLTRAAGHYDPILRNLATLCEGKGKVLAAPAAFTGSQYVLGTTVTLTAQPDAGWRFSGWTLTGPAPAPTTNPFALVMLADTTVTAHFTQVFTLATSQVGQGTLEQNPSSTQVFDAGSTVTLTATPAAGFVFAGWSDGVAPEQKAQNPLVLLMDRNWQISAYFLPEGQSTVTLAVETEGQGAVRVEPDLMFYPVGSTVTLTAAPGKGQRFVRWEGDVPTGSETAPTLTLTMSANRTVRAVFERIPSPPVWMISRADRTNSDRRRGG